MGLTASGLERAIECPPSRVLPKTHRASSAYADKGHAVHSYLCDVTLVGPASALARVPEEHRATCAAIELNCLPLGPGHNPEEAFTYDVDADAARSVGRNIGREYPADGGVHGTADVVRVDSERVCIWDYKTGYGDGQVTSAARNWQLACLALMACRTYRKDYATVTLVHIHDDGTHHMDSAELGPLELAATAEAIARVVNEAPSGDTKEGPWCKYCPSFSACPAKAALPARLAGLPVPVLNEETAPRVWEVLEQYDALAKRVRESLEEYARLQPVQLPDGRVLGEVERSVQEIDAEAARAALGDEVWSLAVETRHELTKKALEATLRARLAPGQKLAPVVRDTMRVLELAGALKVKTYRTVRPHKPKTLPAETEGIQT